MNTFHEFSIEEVEESSKNKKNNNPVAPITTHVCCDIVFEQNGNKYIAGTNQLFPVFSTDFCNGCKYPVSLYVYTAMKWKELFYTDSGDAVAADDEPEALLGYNHGLDVIRFKNATPCLVPAEVGHRKEQALTIDQWCRLSHKGILTNEFMPKLWIESEFGSEFWTPDKGMIRAIPTDIPIVLHSAEEFCDMVGYNSSVGAMLQRITMMLNMYVGNKTLYIGFSPETARPTEDRLIEASKWFNTHYRRIGIQKAKNTLLDTISGSAARSLAISLANKGFEREEIFA